MQYIPIKEEEDNNGNKYYTVQAIPLKNTKNSIVQRIPHPLGTDTLTYKTLEDAQEAILRAGFSYIQPNGNKGSKQVPVNNKTKNKYDYEKLVLNAIKNKIDSQNSAIAAAAITAIAEFPCEETFDILFNKIGEENDQIRKKAILSICRYGTIVTDRIIEALKSSNWVTRNSALTCIQNIAETQSTEIEQYIPPLCQVCDDINTIVQANALITIAKVYQYYKKNAKI